MIGLADIAWEAKCREEDMKQRALENERHAIDDARRSVDIKAEQLKVLANQSALFAGFSMIGVCTAFAYFVPPRTPHSSSPVSQSSARRERHPFGRERLVVDFFCRGDFLRDRIDAGQHP